MDPRNHDSQQLIRFLTREFRVINAIRISRIGSVFRQPGWSLRIDEFRERKFERFLTVATCLQFSKRAGISHLIGLRCNLSCMSDVTRILRETEAGDPQAALGRTTGRSEAIKLKDVACSSRLGELLKHYWRRAE